MQTGDQLSTTLRTIRFPQGLNMQYSYLQAQAKAPLMLEGLMNVFGLPCYGKFSFDLSSNTGRLEIEAPPYKVGGGNLRFYS